MVIIGEISRGPGAPRASLRSGSILPVQGNTSFTRPRGTVRGMHFQRRPKADAKLVRCTAGRIHDVIVDLREDSPTRGEIYVNQLAADIATMLYVPPGFAHGFQTLSDSTVVEYLMGVKIMPDLHDGFRYDDPAIGIVWPETVTVLSANDARWPPLADRGFRRDDQAIDEAIDVNQAGRGQF